MRLSDLLGPEIETSSTIADCEITAVTSDSRKVVPAAVFVALAGTKTDGSAFIADAVSKGAAAILAASDVSVPADVTVPILRAANPRLALAKVAARFYGAQPGTIIAVTGTSGKSSVADFTRQIWTALGKQAASIGTIGVVKPDGSAYGALTTPDPVTLASVLSDLAGEGVTHAALEASSHGLDQFRLDGVRLAAGAFTNLGRDHLDYHPSVEHYLQSKLRLFGELLEPGQPAVINADGARSADVIAAAQSRGLNVLTVGAAGQALRLRDVTRDGFAQVLTIEHAGKTYTARLPLVGAYQTENAIVAAGLVIALGAPVSPVMAALGALKGVSGRLEIIGERNGGLGIVDYAHKPEALEAALAACRPFAPGKLISVFGCGGDRDRGKRPIMGEISTRLADVTIITDDNPRTEVPAAIRAEILAGAAGAQEIGDREQAIFAGARMLQPGDVLLVAGKGHETGQIIGDRVIPFSDQDVLRRALGEQG